MTDQAQETKVFARSNFDLNKQVSGSNPMREKPEIQQSSRRSSPQNQILSAQPNQVREICGEVSDRDASCVANPSRNGEPHSDEDKGASSSASATGRKFNKQQSRRGPTKKLQRISSHVSDFTTQKSRFGMPPAAPALSREERKNEAIMRMIERQEKQERRREQKKLGIIERSVDDHSHDESRQQVGRIDRQSCKGKARGSVAQARESKKQSKANTLGKTIAGKRHQNSKPAYEISVVFQDGGGEQRSTVMSRYFYERKQHYEEKTRFDFAKGCKNPFLTTEQLHHWASSIQQEQLAGQSWMYGCGTRVPAGTGGNETNNEDFSHTSSVSSLSKRQRIDDYRFMIGRQLMYNHMYNAGGMAAPFHNGYISQSVQPPVTLSGPVSMPQEMSQRCASEEKQGPDASLNVACQQGQAFQPIRLENQPSSVNYGEAPAASETAQDEEEKVQQVLEATKKYLQKIKELKNSVSAETKPALEQPKTQTLTSPSAIKQ